MTDTDVIRRHIEIVQGAGGPKAVISGHRIRVMDVVTWTKMGMSPDEIVDAYPTLTMADVHAALAFYWDNREELEAKLAADEAFEMDLRRAMDEGPLLEKLVERLRRRSG